MDLPMLVVQQKKPFEINQRVETEVSATEDKYVRMLTKRDLKIKVNYVSRRYFRSYTKESRDDFNHPFNFRCTKRSINSFSPNLFILSVVNQAVKENRENNPYMFPKYVSVCPWKYDDLSLVFTNDILICSKDFAAVYSPTNNNVSDEELEKQENLMFPQYMKNFGMIFDRMKYWVITERHHHGAYVDIDGKYYCHIKNAWVFDENCGKTFHVMLKISYVYS